MTGLHYPIGKEIMFLHVVFSFLHVTSAPLVFSELLPHVVFTLPRALREVLSEWR